MADNDDLIPDRVSGAVAFPTEAAWDNLKETVNNNRRYRLLGIYTTGTITYNGTSSLAWTADIKILFMATNSDTYYVNTVLSSGSPLTCADDNIIWCRLLNSTSNVTLNASTIANFTRAGDLSNQTGDVLIIGFTDTTQFHQAGGGGGGGGTHPVVETDGGTGQTSYVQGDILYSDVTNSLAKLPKGTNGQFLQIGATIPAWVADPKEGVHWLTISFADWGINPVAGNEVYINAYMWQSGFYGNQSGHLAIVNFATMDISGKIPLPNGKTVTINEIHVRMKNDGGGVTEPTGYFYTQAWDGETSSVRTVDTIFTSVGTVWETKSLTGLTREIYDGSTNYERAWIYVTVGNGWTRMGSVRVKYTIA